MYIYKALANLAVEQDDGTQAYDHIIKYLNVYKGLSKAQSRLKVTKR